MADDASRVPTIQQLRTRSERLFTDLLQTEFPTPTRGRKAGARAHVSQRTGRPSMFSWFDPADAARATALAAELAIRAGSEETSEAGLSSALDLAESRSADEAPGLVRQALAMFVTHHKPARRLGKPRSVAVRPEAFIRSKVGTTAKPSRATSKVGRVGRTGGKQRTLGSTTEAQLDYWREDALANEHHEHWHEVYPYSGLLPGDWVEWATAADRRGLAALLQALEPRPANQWLTFVQTRPPQEVATAFLDRARQVDFGTFVRQLAAEPYRVLFRLNDRQGELFVYMHRQMLARYDAERLSVGLARLQPFGPPFTSTPPDGYDPAPLPGYLPRAPGRKLVAGSASNLVQLQEEVSSAITAKRLDGTAAAGVPIDRTNIGEVIEAADARLRVPLRAGRYPGLHNIGHGRIAAVSAVPGDQRGAVMNDPSAAIRDPIFWRWHKNIDDVAFTWEEGQARTSFADRPAVVVRSSLPAASGRPATPAAPWTSPDIYLVSRATVEESANAPARITTALAGARRDRAVADIAVPGLPGYRFTSELGTMFKSRRLAGVATKYLTHQPFGYAVRMTNPAATPANVTVRAFIAPADLADDRRAWIELDKVAHTVAPSATSVLYRSDRDVSVIKRPAETDPAQVQAGGTDPDDESYCVCGWPWTLLLPRGRPDGMTFRMIVICTDGALDQVPQPTHCGSMSYCGAVDRYPDLRDMGYPFARPLGATITQTFAAADAAATTAAAGRTFTIRHLGQQ